MLWLKFLVFFAGHLFKEWVNPVKGVYTSISADMGG